MKQLTIAKILETVNSYIEGEDLTIEQIDEDLINLGVDSIKFMQTVITLEEYYKCEFPDEKIIIEEMNTINKIYDVLNCVMLKEKCQ